MSCSENNSIAKVHSLVKTPLKKSLMIIHHLPGLLLFPPSAPTDEADNVINKVISDIGKSTRAQQAILTKIPNQPVGNEDAAVARKKMVNNMVEEEGLRNITAHGTTTSPLTKHVDESSGDNPSVTFTLVTKTQLHMDELKLPDENSFLLIEIPSFSLGLSQEEMQVRNDYEVTLPPLCMEAMDSTTQFSRTRTAVVAIT
ncbi:hypothetical protein Bca4012_049278 [Brassica carinata]|uniref:Uncharacterized protein n=1 Tax=Brassica carinata TaxID=52824 RepID=A0A8X7R950_BRACI|nr:hypothetical protein Bca52824_052059 [Brassica carinata]